MDIITNATNIPINSTQDPRFASWIAKRRYTSDFLNSRGLLQNQVVLHKTYPSNSGYSPNGAEKLARTEYGMNMMNPKCAASLMLEIVEGKLFPEARSYMMQLLLHDTYSYTCVLAFMIETFILPTQYLWQCLRTWTTSRISDLYKNRKCLRYSGRNCIYCSS